MTFYSHSYTALASDFQKRNFLIRGSEAELGIRSIIAPPPIIWDNTISIPNVHCLCYIAQRLRTHKNNPLPVPTPTQQRIMVLHVSKTNCSTGNQHGSSPEENSACRLHFDRTRPSDSTRSAQATPHRSAAARASVLDRRSSFGVQGAGHYSPPHSLLARAFASVVGSWCPARATSHEMVERRIRLAERPGRRLAVYRLKCLRGRRRGWNVVVLLLPRLVREGRSTRDLCCSLLAPVARPFHVACRSAALQSSGI